ncbi:MAG: porin family protein [Planctomycetota bacterium]|jgi:hypothetical protein
MRTRATFAFALLAPVALAAFAPGGARAASITFGARGGGGISTFVGGDADDVDPSFAYSAGGFMTVSFANFELQPEFLLSKKGASVSATRSFNSGGDLIVVSREETDDLTYFEMPILFKKSGRTGYAFGGVSLGILLDGSYDLSYTQTRNGAPDGGGSDSGDIDGADSFDLGLVVGGGARLRYMTVDARLSYGLQSIDSSRDVKNLVFSVMAGYHF